MIRVSHDIKRRAGLSHHLHSTSVDLAFQELSGGIVEITLNSRVADQGVRPAFKLRSALAPILGVSRHRRRHHHPPRRLLRQLLHRLLRRCRHRFLLPRLLRLPLRLRHLHPRLCPPRHFRHHRLRLSRLCLPNPTVAVLCLRLLAVRPSHCETDSVTVPMAKK
jgi:hypothetical protein